ncbi:MAG: ACT domain-containing protein [Bacteroidaceae bacterium]|nr:ACT domain-containing protein [Bacteroidaceae bacterium]
MEKVIISVLGRDTVGIIARVCTYLSKCNVNVNDISQTIIQGYFNMMMIVDLSGSSKVLGDIQNDLNQIGEELGVQIKCQREDIFDKMHRI